MSNDHDNTDALLLTGARHHLSGRLHGLARRALGFDAEAIVEMHAHLDLFRIEQQERRDRERADKESA